MGADRSIHPEDFWRTSLSSALAQDRTSDTLRLVAEWLDSAEAREARRKLFGNTFIAPGMSGPGQSWRAFRVTASLNNEIVQRMLEDVIAQFDRVGGYLARVSHDARAAVFVIYSQSVARCWLVVGPYIGDLRLGRGLEYVKDFVGLAQEAIAWMESHGIKTIHLHPFGNPLVSAHASTDEASAPFGVLETASHLTDEIARQ